MLAFGLSATTQAASASSADQEPIATARVAPSPTNAPAMPAPAVDKPPAAPMTTSEQIDAYLRAAPTTPWQDAEALDQLEGRPARQIHGQVGVAVGTGGYAAPTSKATFP